MLKQIEAEAGRDLKGGVRYGPRPLDLDIIFYGSTSVQHEKLVVPHPRSVHACVRAALACSFLSQLHNALMLMSDHKLILICVKHKMACTMLACMCYCAVYLAGGMSGHLSRPPCQTSSTHVDHPPTATTNPPPAPAAGTT